MIIRTINQNEIDYIIAIDNERVAFVETTIIRLYNIKEDRSIANFYFNDALRMPCLNSYGELIVSDHKRNVFVIDLKTLEKRRIFQYESYMGFAYYFKLNCNMFILYSANSSNSQIYFDNKLIDVSSKTFHSFYNALSLYKWSYLTRIQENIVGGICRDDDKYLSLVIFEKGIFKNILKKTFEDEHVISMFGLTNDRLLVCTTKDIKQAVLSIHILCIKTSKLINTMTILVDDFYYKHFNVKLSKDQTMIGIADYCVERDKLLLLNLNSGKHEMLEGLGVKDFDLLPNGNILALCENKILEYPFSYKSDLIDEAMESLPICKPLKNLVYSYFNNDVVLFQPPDTKVKNPQIEFKKNTCCAIM